MGELLVFWGGSLPLDGAGSSPEDPKPSHYGYTSASSLGTRTPTDRRTYVHTNETVIEHKTGANGVFFQHSAC